MATGTVQPKANKDTYNYSPEELVLDRDWNGRWIAVGDEPSAKGGGKNDFERDIPTSIRELAASIREHGQLEDVLICKRPADDQGRTLHVVAGQSRTRAITLLATENPTEDWKVRCRLLPGNIDDRQAFLINEEENRKRNNLTLLDKAFCMKREKDLGMTTDEIATRWGCSVQAVGQALVLIEAPPEVQQAVADKIISATNVISDMKNISDEEKIEIVNTARIAVSKNTSFKPADVRKMVRKFVDAQKQTTTSQPPSGEENPTNGETGTATATPTPDRPRRRGRPASTDKRVPRAVADFRNALKGREGPLSAALLRYFDGYTDMDDAALQIILDEFEYPDDTESEFDALEPRTEGNPVETETVNES